MKKVLAFLTVFIIIAGMFAFRAGTKKIDDIFKQLGISQEDAKVNISSSFRSNFFSYPMTTAIKSLVPEKRGEVVKEIGAFTKKYLQSAEYAQQFNEQREAEKPKEPLNTEQQFKKTHDDLQKTVKEMEESAKTAPADMKTMYTQSITSMKQQMKMYSDPNDPKYKSMKQIHEQYHLTEMAEYKKKLQAFNENNPTDPKEIIRNRLQRFLSVSGDVDFAAELKAGPNGKKVFVNPDYEKKPPEWKMCYRAGREAVAAARTFAGDWLNELK